MKYLTIAALALVAACSSPQPYAEPPLGAFSRAHALSYATPGPDGGKAGGWGEGSYRWIWWLKMGLGGSATATTGTR